MLSENFIYRGFVTRVETDGVYVTIPRIGGGMEFGPCESPPQTLVAGDTVICAQVEDILEDIVVLTKVSQAPTP